MTRSFLAVLLAVLSLLGGSRVAVQQHRCMGQHAGVSLASVAPQEHHRCDRCGMDRSTSRGCCEDIVTLLKAADGHRFFPAPPAWTILEWVALPVRHWSPASAAPAPRLATTGFVPDTRPPPAAALPRYLRLRVLRL